MSHTEVHGRRGPSAYIAIWALAAAIALAYLAVFTQRPDLIGRYASRPGKEPAETQRHIDKLTAENAALKAELRVVKSDLEELKSVVAERQARDKAIADRMASMAPPASGLPPGPAEKEVTTGTIGPAVLSIDLTGSKPGPAEPRAVQLSTARTIDELRLAWSLLVDQNKALFKGLEPRYVDLGNGTGYQLVAGPIPTPAEAQKVCAVLKPRKLPCSVGTFRGAAL